jgi:hypothetical protein
MANFRRNGGVLGIKIVPGTSSANGIWTLSDQQQNIGSLTWPGLVFAGGSQSFSSLKTMGEAMISYPEASPTLGGSLTIDSVNIGNYDYTIKKGNQTVSSFTEANWFTVSQDRSAIIAVDGNLTINAGITFTPTYRKLFTFIYVKGNLTINGTVTMTKRGANHSGTGTSGGTTPAAAIRIASGTFSSVVNPQIPSAGGSGAPASSGTGNSGTAGTSGGTGGGGSGSTGTGGTGGAGAPGTSFSGGPGGGGRNTGGATNAPAGTPNGGRGGDAASSGPYTGAGTGNPGGTGVGSNTSRSGTGGVLIIICTGILSGSGTVSAAGEGGGTSSGSGGTDGNGGASGGGSVTIMYGTDSSTITPTASGGSALGGGGPAGGAGGAGTARKLSL